jgi:DNA-3-methyladenine glycosylase
MIRFFDREYVLMEPDFLAEPSWLVGPRMIGTVLAMDYRDADAALALSVLEAYDEVEGAVHGADSQRLGHGHVYVHPYERSGMWAMDIVCGPKDRASSLLIREGIPVFGLEAMARRRGADPAADRRIRTRAKGYEKILAKGPCAVGEALDIRPALDGAWLFDKPFRLYRPVEPIAEIEIATRINVGSDAHLPWRWSWRNPPAPSSTEAAA